MARAAYFDCFSGASGDMLLGALLDAGLDIEALKAGLSELPIGGWGIEAERIQSHGLSGTRANVRVDAQDQPHRGLGEVLRIIGNGALPTPVVERSTNVFERLAQVEASIHGTSTEEVEFHEVGALDSIVDVVGVVLGLHLLGVGQVTASGLPLGTGWVRAAHGRLPVPAPATLELMRRVGAPTRSVPAELQTGELTTPTAAALLTVLGTFSASATLGRVEQVGYGFGTRQLPWPNALRLMLGQMPAASSLERDQVVLIETNLDDITPEALGFAMERLIEAGALDVSFSPLQMKKNRPGVLLRVLAHVSAGQQLAELVLEHTSALGVRFQTLERLIVPRGERRATTPWGEVRLKIKHLADRDIAAPEYEDCARLARAHGVSLAEVYAAALNVQP